MKELNGVWAIDGYKGKDVYVNGAFYLKDGSDDLDSVLVEQNPEGTLLLHLLNLEFAKGSYRLTEQPDGSFLGQRLKYEENVLDNLILRRINPPKDVEPLQRTALSGKWITIPGYLEKESLCKIISGQITGASELAPV